MCVCVVRRREEGTKSLPTPAPLHTQTIPDPGYKYLVHLNGGVSPSDKGGMAERGGSSLKWLSAHKPKDKKKKGIE